MVLSAMSIQYKPHLDAEAKEVEGKLQASLGELSCDTGQNLQDDAQQEKAFALKVCQTVEETCHPLVDQTKKRATQVFHKQLTGQQWP
jgi:hypothetical protein